MSKITLLLLTILSYVYVRSISGKSHLEEYCWRDFEGVAPSDAFVAGVDQDGEKNYIGQVLYEDKLIPGKLYDNNLRIYFEWADAELTSQENIKILCTNDPKSLVWVQTNKNKVGHLTDKLFIKGGFEPGYITYLGRVLMNSSVSVGKVLCTGSSCLPMYTTENHKGKNYNEFEILISNSFHPRSLDLVDSYYWKDFSGIVPIDALPGGFDQNARRIYIGQVLYEDKLIPGKIYEKDPNIYFEFKQVGYKRIENIKILSSPIPEKFEWLPTNTHDIYKMTTKILIKGGYEPQVYTYLGRIYTGGETSVGKVICSHTQCLGLYIEKNGRGLMFNQSFDVLTFKTD